MKYFSFSFQFVTRFIHYQCSLWLGRAVSYSLSIPFNERILCRPAAELQPKPYNKLQELGFWAYPSTFHNLYPCLMNLDFQHALPHHWPALMST